VVLVYKRLGAYRQRRLRKKETSEKHVRNEVREVREIAPDDVREGSLRVCVVDLANLCMQLCQSNCVTGRGNAREDDRAEETDEDFKVSREVKTSARAPGHTRGCVRVCVP